MQGPDRAAVEAATTGATGRIGLIGDDHDASENDSARPANLPTASDRVEIIAYAGSRRATPDSVGTLNIADGVAAFELYELSRVQAFRVR